MTALLSTASPAPPRLELLDLADVATGATLPVGWDLRPIRGRAEPSFSIRRDEPALTVEGRDAAAFAYRRLPRPLAPAAGHLRWSWRTLDPPESADLRDAERDDSALRVYVVFGRPRALGASRAIFYTWGHAEPGPFERPAFESDRMHVVRIAGSAEANGAWREESVEPFSDYRRIWGEEPKPITAVGVLQDTDATGDAAAAELRELYWQPAG